MWKLTLLAVGVAGLNVQNLVNRNQMGLTNPCAEIKCGEVKCAHPLKLKMDGSCCGICWAPDHVVPAASNNDYTKENLVQSCPEGHKHCSNTKCFHAVCAAGKSPQCKADNCCPTCATSLLSVANTTVDAVAAAVEAQRQTPRIHDHFARMASGDHTNFVQLSETPDVDAEVSKEREETPHITQSFKDIEDADVEQDQSFHPKQGAPVMPKQKDEPKIAQKSNQK